MASFIVSGPIRITRLDADGYPSGLPIELGSLELRSVDNWQDDDEAWADVISLMGGWEMAMEIPFSRYTYHVLTRNLSLPALRWFR